MSSTLNWKDRGLALTQTTDLPLTNKVTLTITAAPTDAVSIQFRRPEWAAGCAIAVAINGQPVTPTDAKGFLGVSRVWRANDEIELALPFFVRASRLPDNANAVAFTYGPLVLSAGLGTAAMTTTGHAWTIAATSPGGLQDAINAGVHVCAAPDRRNGRSGGRGDVPGNEATRMTAVVRTSRHFGPGQ